MPRYRNPFCENGMSTINARQLMTIKLRDNCERIWAYYRQTNIATQFAQILFYHNWQVGKKYSTIRRKFVINQVRLDHAYALGVLEKTVSAPSLGWRGTKNANISEIHAIAAASE